MTFSPAAADTLVSFFQDTDTTADDYDIIFTGDLGRVGTDLLYELMSREGFDIRCHHSDCGMMIYDLENQDVHLVLIDVELDKNGWGTGIETLRHIRMRSKAPVIVISEQTSETAKITVLNAGADDYVIANGNPLVLLAIIKSQLRRYTQLVNMCNHIEHIYRIDDLVVNDKNRTVTVSGREVKLTPIEYKILRLLVQQRGKVLSITQIYESIWHMQAIGADNTIAVHIRHIREKIESNPKEPRYLKVVWGTGYKVG